MQEKLGGPSRKEMGLTSGGMGVESDVSGVESGLDDEKEANPEKASEVLAEKLESDLVEQISELEDDKNAQTWAGRFGQIGQAVREKLTLKTKMFLEGVMTAGQFGLAANAFAQNRKGEAAMWLIFSALGANLVRRDSKAILENKEAEEGF